jgi:ribose transport system ATP-binding protein
MKRLREDGVSIVYISHKLDEVMEIADEITVLRDGKNAGRMKASEATRDRIVSMMVGRELSAMFPKGAGKKGDVVLEVESLSSGGALRDVSFSARRGEILGIAGLLGAGQMTLARVLFGIERIDGGTVRVHGKRARLGSPGRAIQAGLGFMPDDRKEEGLVLGLSVSKNLTLAVTKRLTRFGFLSGRLERSVASKLCRDLSIKAKGPDQPVKFLSGGNQQKVVLGKWLALGPDILILCEPTRGIDVGAKVEMYNLMNRLAAGGKCIVLISSELPELISLSDRIIVMFEGRVAGEVSREAATQTAIMNYAVGGRAG